MKKSISMDISRYLFIGFVCSIYIFLLFPLIIIVLASFNSGEFLTFPPEGFSIRWYVSFFNSDAFMDSMAFSLKLAFLCTICATCLGTTAALYVVRYAGKWREAIRLFILMPLLLPEILTAIGLLFFYYNFDALGRALGLPFLVGLFRNGFLGLLIGHILITLPFVFLSVASSLYNFDRSIEEAAQSLGSRPLDIFWKITLPIIKPGMISASLLCFIISFDLFAISLLLKGIGIATLPIQLFDYVRWDFDPTAAAVATVSIIITVIVIIATDKLVGLKSIRF